ncbi:hypothetical protein Tco_1555550 [Tanacetum coccineum]
MPSSVITTTAPARHRRSCPPPPLLPTTTCCLPPSLLNTNTTVASKNWMLELRARQEGLEVVVIAGLPAFRVLLVPFNGHIHEKHGQLGDLSSVSQPRKAVRILQNDTTESVHTAQEVYVGGNDVGRTYIYKAGVCGNLQCCPVPTFTTTGPGSVNDSLIINEPPVDTSYLPNVETIVDLFNVQLKFLKDIDVLTRRIEAGECEDVMMLMTSVERKASMEAIEAVWKKIVYIQVPHENNLAVDNTDPMGSNQSVSDAVVVGLQQEVLQLPRQST